MGAPGRHEPRQFSVPTPRFSPPGRGETAGRRGRPPQFDDHWHAILEIIECGESWPVFEDQTDPNGIHTHGDGLVHIHPFSDAATGTRATLGAFLSAMQFDADPDRLTSPISGLRLGEVDCDGQVSETRLLRWSADGLGEPPRVILGDDIRSEFFASDREVWVVARVAVSTDNDDIVVSPDRVETLDFATG